MHFQGININEPTSKNINKFIFDTVDQLNKYSASEVIGEKVYWKQERSTSKKLELRLQYPGLYYI